MFPLSNSPEDNPFLAEGAQKALHVPVGASSPLWFVFAGAAGVGVAFWWMTRWAQATNLEALLAAPQATAEPAAEVVAPVAPEPEALLDVPVEAVAAPEPQVVEPEPASFAAIAEAAAEETSAPRPARAKPGRVVRTDGEASAD